MPAITPDSSAAPRADLSAFPRGFRWSAATAAFQIEGARFEGGRTASIWDDFVATPGAVIDGSNSEPGCDSYHRFGEDVALLAGLGADRYRFGISWARVQPDAVGTGNQVGLDYYRRLVDALLAAGITPAPTLYHWDLPSPLEASGGWLNRETALRFADYASIVVDALGDRVHDWYTINEPVSTSLQGYAIGELAPGKQLLFGSLPTVHHQLLAHGLGLQVLRSHGTHRAGIVNNHTSVLPASDSVEDQTAAAIYDMIHNGLFAAPVLGGAYPDLEAFGLPPMPVHDGDLALISAPQDFYGVNFYNPTTIAAAPEESPIPFQVVPTPGAEVTGFGPEWPIVPSALTDVLVRLRDEFGEALPPIIIGENGASFPEPGAAGFVNDENRISYLAGHISAVGAALAAGVDVEEYTVWSLLDNFEWASGYTQRFGLVHVDFDTAERTPKASYEWYRALIAEARANAELSE